MNTTNLSFRLTSEEARFLRSKWARIRASQAKADKAGSQWEILNEAINRKLDAEGEFDIVQRDKIKGANLTLKGHLATHKWHSDEAIRHTQDLQLFIKLKEIGAL